MGCCTSNRQKSEESPFKTVNLPEIFLSINELETQNQKVVSFYILEIKFTKVFEKITSFPCSCFLQITEGANECTVDLGDIWNYVHGFDAEKTAQIAVKDNCEDVYLSLIGKNEEKIIEIASAAIQISAIDNYFKGIVTFCYRALKTAFVTIEIHFGGIPGEDLTLSFASPMGDKSKSPYFPCKDYPVDMKKYFTPNFSSEKFSSAQDIYTYETIELIKHPKTQFEELLEFFDGNVPEYVYYAMDRMIYFASQSTYASKLIHEKSLRIKQIFKAFVKDRLIVLKGLEMVFECSRCLDSNFEELALLLDSELLETIFTVAHNRQIAAISLEIVLKYIQIFKSLNPLYNIPIAFCKRVIEFCKKLAGYYDHAEIHSSILFIVYAIIQSCNTLESLSLIFNNDILEFIIESQKKFQLNSEIILMSLKILKLFLTHKQFKQSLIESNGFQHLIPLSQYHSDYDIQKLIFNIINEP